MKPIHYILQIQQNYTFEILRPVQRASLGRGDKVLWLVIGKAVDVGKFAPDEPYTNDIQQVRAFAPDAVMVTGNVVPDFVPGLKVQVFHGFEWKKKGHFRIRGSFDLYCTQGPLFTRKFKALAEQHGNYFDVEQTGWPKMDNFFPLQEDSTCSTEHEQPQILYAPTFSPSFSSASDIKQTIFALAEQHPWQWHNKFHPKMDPAVVAEYAEEVEQFDNVTLHGNVDLIGLIRQSDVVLSDTSSAIAETILLGKPVVTYKNSVPDQYIFDIRSPEALGPTLEQVLQGSAEQDALLEEFAREYHPYRDGKSSERLLDVIEHKLKHGLDAPGTKPKNWIRNIKLRKETGYWRW